MAFLSKAEISRLTDDALITAAIGLSLSLDGDSVKNISDPDSMSFMIYGLNIAAELKIRLSKAADVENKNTKERKLYCVYNKDKTITEKGTTR